VVEGGRLQPYWDI